MPAQVAANSGMEKPRPAAVLEALPAKAPAVVLPDVQPEVLVKAPVSPPPEPETFADRLADLAEHLHGERMPFAAPRTFQESSTERSPVVLDVTFHAESTATETPAQTLLAAPPSMLLLAEPQPPAVAGKLPVEDVFHPIPANPAAGPREPLGAEPAAQEPVRLPLPPERVMAPGLAGLQNYHDAADRQMRPAEFATKTAASKALPTVTLPGPALPRELMSLQAAGLVPVGQTRRPSSLNSYGGIMKYVAVGILLTAGVATYSMLPGSASSSPPRPSPVPEPEPPVSARSVNSLARFVEVTGIRFMEVNKKPQIQYLVVNHSNAPLGSVMVYVTLRAAKAKPGQPPIARLTFRSPALAAYEAKEMFSSIERASAPLDLPDWQDLHAEVEVQ
jgi:hypothetical protein